MAKDSINDVRDIVVESLRVQIATVTNGGGVASDMGIAFPYYKGGIQGPHPILDTIWRLWRRACRGPRAGA